MLTDVGDRYGVIVGTLVKVLAGMIVGDAVAVARFRNIWLIGIPLALPVNTPPRSAIPKSMPRHTTKVNATPKKMVADTLEAFLFSGGKFCPLVSGIEGSCA